MIFADAVFLKHLCNDWYPYLTGILMSFFADEIMWSKWERIYFVFFSVGNLVINWLFRENTEAFESVEINTDKKLLKFKNFSEICKKRNRNPDFTGTGHSECPVFPDLVSCKNGYSSMREKKYERNSTVLSGRISFSFYQSRFDKVSGVFSEKICGESEEWDSQPDSG